MDIKNNILDAIGNTPIVHLKKLSSIVGVNIYAKCEFSNPTGSIKDRIANILIQDAENQGLLKPQYTIVEATAGNTGTALAMVALQKGYKLVLFVPEKISIDKVRLLEAYQAELIYLTKEQCSSRPGAFIEYAKEYASDFKNCWLAGQFQNPINVQAHYNSTAVEIWQQMGGQIDCFFAGMGTGGTLCGVGKFLKEQNSTINVIMTDIEGSIHANVFSGNQNTTSHDYFVEGIGGNFIPDLVNFSFIDDAVKVTDREACYWCHWLLRHEGIFSGSSSGAIIASAVKYVRAKSFARKANFVCILPDTGMNYVNTFYNANWCQEKLGIVINDEMLNTEGEQNVLLECLN